MTATADIHRIEIVSKFFADGYTAECSCGWRSEELATTDAAVQRSREHRSCAADDEFRERLIAATMSRRGCGRAEAVVILNRLADRLGGATHDEAVATNPLPESPTS